MRDTQKRSKEADDYLALFIKEQMEGVIISKEHFAKKFIENPSSITQNNYIYIFDVLKGEIESSAGVETVLGYREEKFTTNLLYSSIHEDDAKIIYSTIPLAYSHLVANGETTPLESNIVMNYRVRNAKGEYLHIKDTLASLVVDEEGGILKTINFCKHITHTPFTSLSMSVNCSCGEFIPEFMKEKEYFRKNSRTILSDDEFKIKCLLNSQKSTSQICSDLSITIEEFNMKCSSILSKSGLSSIDALKNLYLMDI